jgi:hypothetical protein
LLTIRFPLLQEFIDEPETPDSNYYEQRGYFGRIQGMIMNRKFIKFFEDANDFDDFYNDYSALELSKSFKQKKNTLNTYISPIPKKVVEKTSTPSPTKGGLLKTPPTSSPVKQSTSSEKKTVSSTSTESDPKITMTISDVMKHFGIIYFQRGRDYWRDGRISKQRTKIVNKVAFKLYSRCQGSREKPYKQEVLNEISFLLITGRHYSREGTY